MATQKVGRKVPLLSKSRFMAGIQCPLRLWYQCYNPEMAAETSDAQQAIFDTGNEVGRLAHRLYPGGVLIEEDHLQHEQAVKTTLTAMRNPGVPAIFEAAFVQDGVRIRVDVLERAHGGAWNMVEVKSTASVKDEHVSDVAVQYHVLHVAGLKVGRAGLLHLNNEYVYDGISIDLPGIFTLCDLTGQALSLRAEVSAQIKELRAMLAGGEPPRVESSKHCDTPNGCEFWDHCTKDKPEFWVRQLSGIHQSKLDKLAAVGIEDIRAVPDSFQLSKLQARIRGCVISQEEYFDPQLADALRDVGYPAHFLDFETVMMAVPRYAGTRPYQTLPFQWSDHVLLDDGTLEHREYLCTEDKDPRKEFTRTLLDALGEQGTILIYTSYEKRIIRELAEQFPRHSSRLLALMDRFCDLEALVKRYYYHPSFYGSFSLKAVLPALIPEMNYDSLVIGDGNEASREYLRMVDPATSTQEREVIRRALLTYCGQDTLAMVRVRNELLARR
ncbi:MAG: DUF2779 domain-containing protein [Pseudomonadota bacterium]